MDVLPATQGIVTSPVPIRAHFLSYKRLTFNILPGKMIGPAGFEPTTS
jgi:hypothetical protein